MRHPNTKALRRFFSRVSPSMNGCWIWTGRLHRGYGGFAWLGVSTTAHRVAHWWFVGPVPNGRVVDHLCRETRCVNPAHLEAVSQAQNVQRGNAALYRATCRRGHAMTPDNIHMQTNYNSRFRTCLICRTARNEARRNKRRAVAQERSAA